MTGQVGDCGSKPIRLNLVLGIGFSETGLVPAARRDFFLARYE